MKNYQDGDYALNKHSAGIVYRFADQIMEVTLESYLAENPGKTERDFLELKALSDADYLERDRAEYRQTWKNTSIHSLDDDVDFGSLSLEDAFIDRLDRRAAAKAFRALLADGKLTETQERRFRLYVFERLTHREIARREGVNHRAVGFSVNAAIVALKKYFQKL